MPALNGQKINENAELATCRNVAVQLVHVMQKKSFNVTTGQGETEEFSTSSLMATYSSSIVYSKKACN